MNTNFDDDAYTRKSQPFGIDNISALRQLHAGGAYSKSTIEDFLGTPVCIREYTVSTSDNPNITLGTGIKLPFDSSNIGWTAGPSNLDTGVGMWMSRLNGYLGFRATAVLRYQVNVNRFAQGRLLVHYIPGSNLNVSEVNGHRYNLRTRTQLPRTEINLNQDTSTIFEVPYVSANGMYNLQQNGVDPGSKRGTMGQVFTCVYSKLLGVSSIKIRVWLHFKDIELLIPTWSPQSSLKDKEAYSGVVSAPANHISQAAKHLGKIPLLSSIAGVVERFSKGVALTAANFGFSKPLNFQAVSRFSSVGNADMLSIDVPDASAKTSYNRGQGIDIMPGFAGNDIDEMALEYICNRPCFQTSFDWTTAGAVGTQLAAIVAEPRASIDVLTVAGTSCETMSPFALMCSLTGLWRADFVYTFKLVKTEFHTGKLCVAFRPGQDTNAWTYDNTAYLPREIVDIKESDTFTFKIPYTAETPMLDLQKRIGQLRVFIANPLEAPPTVSSTVSVIVEVAAENVAFAGCSSTNFSVLTGDSTEWNPQSSVPTEKIFTLGNLPHRDNNPVPLVTCGETINSVKQIMLRKCALDAWRNTTAGVRQIEFRPFTEGGSFKTGSGVGTPSTMSLAGDRVALISNLYVLSRGGVRYTAAMNGTANDMFACMALRDDSQVAAAYATSTAASTEVYGSGVLPFHKTSNGYFHIEVPQWSNTYAREVNATFTDADIGRSIGESNMYVKIGSTINFIDGTNLKLWRSCAEDYHLGFFIGVPILYREHETIPYSA